MSRIPKHHDPKLPRILNDLIDKIEKDLPYVDAHIESLLHNAEQEQGRKASCAGCTNPGCCYQMVWVTLYEALPIARRLRMEGRATRPFIAKLRELGERQEATGRGAWFGRNQPCVLLTPDKKCSVYDLRPVLCRQYFVFSDPRLCLPTAGTQDVVRLNARPVELTVTAQHFQLLQALGLAGQEDPALYLTSLPRMLAIVLEAMASPRDELLTHIKQEPYYPTADNYDEWLDGKNPFAKKGPHGE